MPHPWNPLRSVLITGVSGLVGFNLCRALAPLAGSITGLYRATQPQAHAGARFLCVDLTDLDAARDNLREVAPSLVVNCAACPDIAPCEAEPESARRINTLVPTILADLCREQGARFSAVLGILGYLNIPLVYWVGNKSFLHPKPKEFSMSPEVRTGLFVGMAAVAAVGLVLLLLRVRLAQLEERIELRERARVG